MLHRTLSEKKRGRGTNAARTTFNAYTIETNEVIQILARALLHLKLLYTRKMVLP